MFIKKIFHALLILLHLALVLPLGEVFAADYKLANSAMLPGEKAACSTSAK